MPAMVAAFRPPEILARIAWDRETAHVVRKTRAPRNIFRHVETAPHPVRKYTYMSRSFALGTTQLGLPGPPAGPIDLVSWDLTWAGLRHQAKISCNHPYRDPRRFSAFLSGLPQDIGRSVATGKPYLQFPDRLFGASPYERMMQYEGTALILYCIPAGDEAPYINAFLPDGPSWLDCGGWLLANLGSFYVAVYPIGAHRWLSISEATESSGMLVGAGDLINGWLLRIEALHAGMVVEAVEADEVGDFPSYCGRRRESPPNLGDWLRKDRASVETHDGKLLEMEFQGNHRVDGELVDYAAYPLLEAPGVVAPLGSGRICLSYAGITETLDFGIDPAAPLPPMRVIG